MVKHIVMWNLADKENAAVTAAKMKEKLEGLVGVVPGLKSAWVHKSFAGYDVALVTELESREALAVYQEHPAHLEVKKFIHTVITDRAFCDFEME